MILISIIIPEMIIWFCSYETKHDFRCYRRSVPSFSPGIATNISQYPDDDSRILQRHRHQDRGKNAEHFPGYGHHRCAQSHLSWCGAIVRFLLTPAAGTAHILYIIGSVENIFDLSIERKSHSAGSSPNHRLSSAKHTSRSSRIGFGK